MCPVLTVAVAVSGVREGGGGRMREGGERGGGVREE
jgi:hypothetical protein